MTRTVRKIAAACAMAFAVGAAHAATDPVDWNYSFELKWVDADFTKGSSLVDSHYQDSSVVSWGYYRGDDRAIINDPDRARSSIIIDPVYRGNGTSLVTNGNIVDANAFIHYNNAINGNYETLKDATLQLTITLTAKDGSGYTQTWQQPFEVHFIETANLSGNNVADGDIFTITWDGSYSQTFTYDGFEYSFDYFENYYPNALNPLLASQCSKAGAAANCVGFLTPENGRTRVDFGFKIAAAPVPEPETYAMLLAGLGIVGMVARRRRGYIHG
jgi:hypothetical protein